MKCLFSSGAWLTSKRPWLYNTKLQSCRYTEIVSCPLLPSLDFPPLQPSASLLTLELWGSHSVACISPKEEQLNFRFYQEILSQVIIISVRLQTTPCNFRTTANFNCKWAINSWKLNMTGSIRVLQIFFPSLLSQNIVWNKTEKVLLPIRLSPFYRANHHLYFFSTSSFLLQIIIYQVHLSWMMTCKSWNVSYWNPWVYPQMIM